MKITYYFLLCLTLSATVCATEISAGNAYPALINGQGYLLLDIESQRPIAELQLSSNFSIKDIQPGKTQKLIPLNAGSYQWQMLSAPHFDLPFRLKLSDDKRWSFIIKPGSINYIGHLIVMEQRGFRSIDARLVSRSTLADQTLLQLYPQAAQFPFRYAGYLRDDFPDYFLPANSTTANSTTSKLAQP